jgi:hypothetical protein
MKNELIYGLSFAEYQAIDAINLSLLKEIDDSPGRLDWRRRNPWKPSDAAIMGNAIHTLLLEPEDFARKYVSVPQRQEELPDNFVPVPPECLGKNNQLLKAGRVWWAQQPEGSVPVKPSDWNGVGLKSKTDAYKAWRELAEAQGLTVLSGDAMAQARGAAEAVQSYEPACDLLADSKHEVTMVWQDKQTGLWCKGRMDAWDQWIRAEADIKTTGKSVHQEHIGRTAYAAGWHVQRAYYGLGVEAITGQPVEQHKVIAVEVDEPWRCEVYRMGMAELELGRAKCCELLGKYAHWQHRGEWPLNSGHTLTMEFPGWAFKE